jgi:hypothetical protein
MINLLKRYVKLLRIAVGPFLWALLAGLANHSGAECLTAHLRCLDYPADCLTTVAGVPGCPAFIFYWD